MQCELHEIVLSSQAKAARNRPLKFVPAEVLLLARDDMPEQVVGEVIMHPGKAP